jgi:two-component sensor histidine kinase
MIRKEQTRKATVAEKLMAIDVFSELLASTDPSLVAKYLTEQLREISGARTVILVIHSIDTGTHTIMYASPERRAALFSAEELDLLCPEKSPAQFPRTTAEFSENSPQKNVLEKKGIESIVRFPLTGKEELIATLLLLDLPGVNRIDETVSIVTHLSPVIALALKNSISHKRIENQAAELQQLTVTLEQRVAERTAQLEESNANLKKSLSEKETLIRELYHRTKNTMQVVSGILKLEAGKYPGNSEISNLVAITDDRIQAIALVHQMLYASNDLSMIPIRNYIADLVRHLGESHGIENKNITVTLDVEDVRFLLDTAIPLGLILTELMTNTFKYAFPDHRNGSICVSLSVDESGDTRVTYADNGKGVPEDFDFEGQSTLGMQLIFNISRQQLRGAVSFINKDGLSCIIQFPKPFYRMRV